jgi:NADH:ubiquinone oxidoreductase subunit 6 (subunit J)
MNPHHLFAQAEPPASPADGPTLGRFFAEFWPVLVPVALGLAAVYLLLPRARRFPPLWAGMLAALGVWAVGWWLIGFLIGLVEAILFYVFVCVFLARAQHRLPTWPIPVVGLIVLFASWWQTHWGILAAEPADLGNLLWLLGLDIALLGAVLFYLLAYFMVFQAERFPSLWGALLAAQAVILAGGWLVRFEYACPEAVLFYAFAGLAVLSAGLMVTHSDPVHAALAFAMVVLSTCGLFLLLGAPFLTAATVIVYAGAIVVTFLFVIMLAQQLGYSSADQRSREPFLASLAGFVLLAAVLCVLHRTYDDQSHRATAAQLRELLDRTRKAKDAKTIPDLRAAIGEGREFFQDFLLLIQDKTKMPAETEDARAKLELELDEAERPWRTPDKHWSKPQEKVVAVTTPLKAVYAEGTRIYTRLTTPGRLEPGDKLPASPFAVSPQRAGKPPEPGKLPAENVAGLGRALFTDYLLPVEIAGFLLLVATVGAIAIAARAREGLR